MGETDRLFASVGELRGEPVELVAHGLGGDASGRAFEVLNHVADEAHERWTRLWACTCHCGMAPCTG